MIDYRKLIKTLSEYKVEFILVGGVAARIHGSARVTDDLDVSYRRTPPNIKNLVEALRPFSPYLRGAPPGLPFQWNEETLRAGLNFTLATSIGSIDLLGEIAGGGTFDELLPHSEKISVFGIECRCLGLEPLIRAKRAAGRPKDLDVIAELEVIREEK